MVTIDTDDPIDDETYERLVEEFPQAHVDDALQQAIRQELRRLWDNRAQLQQRLAEHETGDE